jgi:hypothetical protein
VPVSIFLSYTGTGNLLYYNSATPFTITGNGTNIYLSSNGWTDTSNQTVLTVGLTNGYYFGSAISNFLPADNLTVNATNIPNANGECFAEDTNILLADGSYKKIKDIVRGDMVLEDVKTKKNKCCC